MSSLINLQIGGETRLNGWQRLHLQTGPEVDYSGDIRNLSHFADASCAKLYAAQILQQVEPQQLLSVLQGLHRVLVPSGQLLISAPDLDALCKLYLSPHLNKSDRLQVMRMLFGGQRDQFDFNRCGLSFEWLADCLAAAGFGFIQRVDSFEGFTDAAAYAPFGSPVCLNVLAYKLSADALPATILSAAQASIAGQLAIDTMSLSHLTEVLHNPPQALTETAVKPEPPATVAELSVVDAAQIQQTTLKALEHQNSGDATEAKRLFKEVLDLQPTNFAALYSLAVLASQQEEHNEALDWIRKAIATGQNYAPAFFVEAVVLQALGRFDESLVSYEQAVAVDPNYESAIINRSNLYYEMKQHIKALESFAEAIQINPLSDKALAGQGIILTEMNRYEDAIPIFERLLEANPHFDYGRGLLFHAEQHCCDWKRFKKADPLSKMAYQKRSARLQDFTLYVSIQLSRGFVELRQDICRSFISFKTLVQTSLARRAL
jgi:tetratricopeptide (TPR) repeat protein